MEKAIHFILLPLFLLCYFTVLLYKKLFINNKKVKSKPKLIWGPICIISNKYWSNALKAAGYKSITLMSWYYDTIHKKNDFDLYTYELPYINLLRGYLKRFFLKYAVPYYTFLYALVNFDIFHHHFSGGFLGSTPIWRFEAWLLKKAGSKIIITAYGADFYCYSRINCISFRNALLLNYTESGKNEKKIAKKVDYWSVHADIIINGLQVDGLSRWDVLPFNMIVIDTCLWKQKQRYLNSNGKNKSVTVIHTPNHRGEKGTEYIIDAVKELQKEGLKIELILAEQIKNEKILEIMNQKAEILVDQLVVGYALSAIEGMATGLPVLSNLSEVDYTRVFRRYSYLNECPIVSATPENIKDILRILVTNPKLREELGKAGRKYVEKYHSEKTAQYMFGKIYDKIWYGKDVDLMNLFHPLLSEYNKSMPYIKHPLIENQLPKRYYRGKS